jgi:hypothetical protein
MNKIVGLCFKESVFIFLNSEKPINEKTLKQIAAQLEPSITTVSKALKTTQMLAKN